MNSPRKTVFLVVWVGLAFVAGLVYGRGSVQKQQTAIPVDQSSVLISEPTGNGLRHTKTLTLFREVKIGTPEQGSEEIKDHDGTWIVILRGVTYYCRTQ